MLSQWPPTRLHDTSRCFASRSGGNVVTFKKPDKVRISDNEVSKEGVVRHPSHTKRVGPSHSAVGSPRQKRHRPFSSLPFVIGRRLDVFWFLRGSLTTLWPYAYAHFSAILGLKHPNNGFYQCCCTGRVKSGATTSTWRKNRSWSATTPPPTYVTRPEKTKCCQQTRGDGDIGEEGKVYRDPRAEKVKRGTQNVVYLDVGETCRAREGGEYPSPFPRVLPCAALAALPLCLYVAYV